MRTATSRVPSHCPAYGRTAALYTLHVLAALIVSNTVVPKIDSDFGPQWTSIGKSDRLGIIRSGRRRAWSTSSRSFLLAAAIKTPVSASDPIVLAKSDNRVGFLTNRNVPGKGCWANFKPG